MSIANTTARYRPMLASTAPALPTGTGWVFEPKYDGIRILAFATRDVVQLRTRNDIDKAAQFPEVVDALRALVRRRRTPFVLDGEIVALHDGEIGRFQSLQARMHERNTDAIVANVQAQPAVMMIFDVLVKGTRSYVNETWSVRRDALESVGLSADEGAIRIGTAVRDDGAYLLASAKRDGWEGLMAKRVQSTYSLGARSRDWLKIKLESRQEFVVGGWTEPRNSREHLGALLLGYWRDDELQYAGHVGSGFTRETLADMHRRLSKLERTTSPFAEPPEGNERAHWTRPSLVVEVKFNEWTSDGRLRQPIYLGLRDDKDASEVTREPMMATSKQRTKGRGDESGESPRTALARIESAGGDGDLVVGNSTLHVSNLDKVYFAKARKTKGDALRYYADIAPKLLPYLEDRPLILRRYPDGIAKPAFFQQRASATTPSGVRTAKVSQADGEAESRFIGGDLMTLMHCVQLGGIDMNPWHSRIGSLDDADYSILDLDPGPRVPFRRVVEVARWTKDALDALGLHAALKTSGASGLHIYVPLPASTSYETSLLLAQVVATQVAEDHPKAATVERRLKARPAGTVYVDYLQNVEGKSVASVFSLRAQPAASVSMPLAWNELTDDLDPRDFTISTAVADAAERASLWSSQLREPVDLHSLSGLM